MVVQFELKMLVFLFLCVHGYSYKTTVLVMFSIILPSYDNPNKANPIKVKQGHSPSELALPSFFKFTCITARFCLGFSGKGYLGLKTKQKLA